MWFINYWWCEWFRNEKALVHNYKYGFSGFAARLSKNEANSIAQQPGVVSVFPDPILKLHTTRSWDFLKSQTYVEIDNTLSSSTPSSSDIVIGMLDSGSLFFDFWYKRSMYVMYITYEQWIIQGYGQKHQVFQTRKWVQFQPVGMAPAWHQKISTHPTVTGK